MVIINKSLFKHTLLMILSILLRTLHICIYVSGVVSRWRFIKWLSFLKEYNFTMNNYPTSNFLNSIKDFMKETTNIFNKWIYEKDYNSLINQQDEFENILNKSLPINYFNWFRLKNWKMDFLYETGER